MKQCYMLCLVCRPSPHLLYSLLIVSLEWSRITQLWPKCAAQGSFCGEHSWLMTWAVPLEPPVCLHTFHWLLPVNDWMAGIQRQALSRKRYVSSRGRLWLEGSTGTGLNRFKTLLRWNLLPPNPPSFCLSSHGGQTCTAVRQLPLPAPVLFPSTFAHPTPFWCLPLGRPELMQQSAPGFQGLINLGFNF